MRTAAAPAPHDAFDDPSARRCLWLVLGVAFALRLAWGLLIPVVPESDPYAYDTFARTLAHHGVFGWTKDEPFAFWAPGTSAMYALAYLAGSFDYRDVVITNLAVSTLMLLFCARVVGRFYGPRIALFSTAVLAVWPTLVMFTTLLVSEPLYLCLTMAALDAWTSPRRGVVARGLLAGVLLGLATYVRTQALLLPFVYAAGMLLWSGVRADTLRLQLKLLVLSGLMVCCVLAPWTWRNYQLFGAFVPVTTNGAVTLWMGNAPGEEVQTARLPEHVHGLNDYQASKILGAEAARYIREDPGAFLVRAARKLVLLYSNESIGALWNNGGIRERFGDRAVNVFKRLAQASWAAILLLSIAGAAVRLRRDGWLRTFGSPLGLCILYYTAIHVVTLAYDRYHMVMAPSIAMLAASALAALKRRPGRPRAGAPLAPPSAHRA